MADTTSMSIEEIHEELTVQKVVLESLSEATYDGAEDMRQEAHSEIVRLKKLLQTLKLKKEPGTTTGESHHHVPKDRFPGSLTQGDGEPEASKAMQSPSRHGVWRLPDRKRGADSARLSFHDNHVKTRRISPEDNTFSTAMAYSNDYDHIDFIDLTGDDDDIGSDFIAEQLKAEERQKQEWADQQLARQLSSQGSSNQPSGSQSSQNNAFTRLMNSQPALSTPLDDADDDLFRIPGTYDARWDDSSGAGPAFNIPQRRMAPQYIPVSTSSNHNAIKDDPDLIFAGSVTRQPPTPSGRPILASGMNYPDLSRRHPGASPAGFWPNNYNSPGSSPHSSELANLTRWSNGLDFTNLIVAPVALLRQWEEEIATKTKPTHRLSVYVHHGKKASIDELLRYDVVLTTYGTVAQELKRFEKIVEDHKERGGNINWNDTTISSKLSLLHPVKAQFYRVILDEAQCIKNKDTKGAKACTQLKSIHRWCLTGTPMMNGIIELYSLVKFLRIKPYSKWEEFRQGFGVLFGRNGDPKHVAMDKLQALLKAIMLRLDRIKEVEAFECPICYDAVQCPSFFIPCGHDSCSECLVKIVESASAVNLQEGNESSRAKCPVCRGQFDPVKCFSYETFREVHMPETIKKDSNFEPAADVSGSGDDSETESESDYESDDEVDKNGNLKGFIVNDEFPADDEKVSVKKQSKGKGKRKNKGKGKSLDVKPAMLKTLRKEAYKNREAFKKYMRYLRKTWEPAAKVTECMNLIKKIEETGEKTIIFSQWTLLLDLLQVAMSHEKMAKPERYDGSMSATLRNIAAQNFRERRDTKVMLVSLRAGNAGLNLTAASRVIIMDPFWNPYIEMQAVDRAYRIGQQQEVKVYRILTKETVEDRIVKLQNKKKEMVEAALDETAGSKIGRLSINDLKNLFGFNR
ncbi:hypothetical protein FPRO04_02992 [Fusarium proliferatum]|nr:hypothetical protein FPRO04_02992 [Fusarium proliferatum]